jgi:hypothetical protein
MEWQKFMANFPEGQIQWEHVQLTTHAWQIHTLLPMPCPAFTFTFACVSPIHFRQYLHKLKVFFVKGTPRLFSAMLHPCNLALHEVKVSTALKIIKVRLYKSFYLYSGSSPILHWRYCQQINEDMGTKSWDNSWLPFTLDCLVSPTFANMCTEIFKTWSVSDCLAHFTSHSNLGKKICILHPILLTQWQEVLQIVGIWWHSTVHTVCLLLFSPPNPFVANISIINIHVKSMAS